MLADEYIDSNKEDPSGERKTKTEPRVLLKNISASWGTSEKNTTTSDKVLWSGLKEYVPLILRYTVFTILKCSTSISTHGVYKSYQSHRTALL